LRSAINKACSSSWLTVGGRWAAASDRHSQSCLQTLFFFSFDETTTELLLRHQHQDAEGLTPKLLWLKLYCIWTWEFFLTSLCLSNACLAHCWLVHYLSLFISLTLFFVLFFSYFLYLFCFPSLLTLPF
jgi:hypothetical protein